MYKVILKRNDKVFMILRPGTNTVGDTLKVAYMILMAAPHIFGEADWSTGWDEDQT